MAIFCCCDFQHSRESDAMESSITPASSTDPSAAVSSSVSPSVSPSVSLSISPVVSALSDADIRFVIDLCVEAGEIAIKMREGVTIETKTSADDLVTGADKALSDLIVKKLSERFPEDLVLSEEAPWEGTVTTKRRWLIDPIDGTKYYVDNTGQWCVMIGLIENNREVWGCFYMPAYGVALAGGPAFGKALKYTKADNKTTTIDPLPALALPSDRPLRVLVSNNDLKAHPWVKDIPNVEIIRGTSLGIDVFELLNGSADVFVHIRPTLKYWDTAAPGAVALALAMEVGSEQGDYLEYSFASPSHQPHVVIGKKGALSWWRQSYRK
jgi:myo-inositol-1(or 4)-monophosphatase